MQEYIYKYLVLNHKLSIPKLGSFVIKDEPAYVDKASGEIFPPKPVLVFEEGSATTADRSFFDFLTEEMGVDHVMAIQAFNEYAGNLYSNVRDNDNVVIEKLGIFSKTRDGNILFAADEAVYDLLPVLPLQKKVIGISIEKESGKDYWWFYALILFILGVGALAYYYV